MEAIAVLRRIGVLSTAEPPYDGQISIVEQGALSAKFPQPPSSEAVAAIYRLLTPAIEARLLACAIALGPGGSAELTLSASSIVGFMSTEEAGQRVFISVAPKVSSVRMLELALAAGRLPAWRPELTLGADASSSLLEWTLRAFLDAMKGLLSRGGVRATHERVQAELRNRLRGRILIGPLTRNLLRGRPDRLPCEFAALQTDNKYNRTLRWALQVGWLSLGHLPGTVALRREFEAVAKAFGAVPLVSPSAREVRSLGPLPGNLKHYAESLQLARLLLEEVYLEARPGSSPSVGVALDMNDLYQQAFFRLLSRSVGAARADEAWPLSFTSTDPRASKRTTTLKPDVFIPSALGKKLVVIDTKWKDAVLVRAADADLIQDIPQAIIKVRSSDLYQITAYALEAIRRQKASSETGCIAALVYPSVAAVPDFVHQITIERLDIEVRLVAWDLSRSPGQAVEDLWTRLDATRMHGPPGTIPSAA